MNRYGIAWAGVLKAKECGTSLRTTCSLLLAGTLLANTLPALAGQPSHDISYLWHRDLNYVHSYRERLVAAFGPEFAPQLKIVRKPGIYGLIYDLPTGTTNAEQIAGRHTVLLKAGGLRPAGIMPSRDWQFIAGRQSQATPPASKTVTRSPGPNRRSGQQAATSPGSPVAQTAVSTDLGAAVEGHILSLRKKGLLAADERTAWSVYDFDSGQKLVTINEDERFQAASLVKPFFALAYFHQREAGKLAYGSKSRRHMERMIQRSSNISTNWVIKRVGGPDAVQRILKKHYGSIFQDTRIVEYIPNGGRTYRNKASAHDYSRFLYALWSESIPGAKEIKRLMQLPGRDRIYTGTTEVPKGTTVYNKTGSTAHLCGDMGILIVPGRDGKRHAYTIVGIIEKKNRARDYSSWIRTRGDVIRSISDIVYQGISRQHDA